MRLAVAACAATLVVIQAGRAMADVSKDQCVDANTQAQSLRRAGKLAAAREQLRVCSDPSCPGIVRSDCTRRLDELETAQPTLVFDVKDTAGNDVSAVRVTVDGKLLAEHLEGTALRVDPGEHSFGFQVAGEPQVSRTLVLKEGEKGRRERVVVPAPASPAPASPAAVPPAPEAASPSPEAPESPPSSGMGTRRVLGLVAGGVGVAGLAVGAVFGLLASSKWSDQQSACGTAASCPNHDQAVSDHSALVTDGTISTVGFIAGGVLLAGGAVLFLTGGHAPSSTSSAIAVTPTVGPHAGALTLIGRF